MCLYRTPAAPGDYSSTNGTITFGPIMWQNITIPIINDVQLELNETFNVQLMNASPRVTLNPSQATVTIIDDDGK